MRKRVLFLPGIAAPTHCLAHITTIKFNLQFLSNIGALTPIGYEYNNGYNRMRI